MADHIEPGAEGIDLPPEGFIPMFSNRQVVTGWDLGAGYFKINDHPMPSLFMALGSLDVISQADHRVVLCFPIQSVEILYRELQEVRQHPDYASILNAGAEFMGSWMEEQDRG